MPGDAVSPMRIRLDEERRALLLGAIIRFYRDEFDEELSEFRASNLLDLFVRELGPSVYNQGVRDAAAYVQGKLADIEGEIFEREPRP